MNLLKALFNRSEKPIKPNDARDMVELLHRYRVTRMVVYPKPHGMKRWEDDLTDSPTVGKVGTLRYAMVYQAETKEGRKIILEGFHSSRWGTTDGEGDAEERGKSQLHNLLQGDRYVRFFQKMVPGLKVHFFGYDGKLISESNLEEMRKKGEELELKFENPIWNRAWYPDIDY